MDKICLISGCGRKHEARGYCRNHYRRFRMYGDPLVVKQPLSKVYLRSDNLRPARLPYGLAVNLAAVVKRFPRSQDDSGNLR